MSSPVSSDTYEVRGIRDAGRGVVAIRDLPKGTLILRSDLAFHVVFKTYSKETCAHCFTWDRGRTLPIRDNDTAKVFCSPSCQTQWLEEQGEVGLEAWRCLAAFVRRRGQSKSADELMSDAARPERSEIDAEWKAAEKKSKTMLRVRRSPESCSKMDRKLVNSVRRDIGECLEVDVLAYLIAGALFRLQHPGKWSQDVLELAMDERPYKTRRDLRVHCNSFLQLADILPVPLLVSLTPELCRTMLEADNHNAFGIRSGGTDGEEYMGYGVWPSASYFNHACSPNVNKRRVGRTWEFSCDRDIAAGEQCCITYLGGDERTLSRTDRQSRLGEVWGFDCSCGRCQREAAV